VKQSASLPEAVLQKHEQRLNLQMLHMSSYAAISWRTLLHPAMTL
jgi:hypothetical protein